MYIDNIFGSLIEPAERQARALAQADGVRHAYRATPAPPQPGQPIRLELTTGGPLPFAAARCWWTVEPAAGAPLSGEAELRPAGVEWDTPSFGYVRRWAVELPALAEGAMLRYQLAARVSGGERWVYADTQAAAAADATRFAIWAAPGGAPEWSRAAAVYHVFVDRFAAGGGRALVDPGRLDGFYGGTLRGVIEQLDYIQGMGFTAIWLSPIFASPSHHGYDATDYLTVEPRLGSNQDLHDLLAAAHGRGMRVILDFVANHWSHLHPTFQAALADERSPYHDWYRWPHWPDDYATYFGVRELPQLNLDHGPARQHLIDAAAHWLRAGADGLRLDYAYGPPHDFWADFRRACRAARPDCWLFGEVIHHADMLRSYAGVLDGTLDFLLARALRETFAHGRWGVAQLEAFLSGHEAYFPAGSARPAFFDNHDMNRLLFIAGGDGRRVLQAGLALCTLSGPPIIYCGSEVGVTQERPIHGENSFGVFEEARQPMIWGAGQDAALREGFRALLRLRRAHPALLAGARRVLHLDDAAGTYAYAVGDPAAGQVVACFNLGDAPRAIGLPRHELPAQVAERLAGLPLADDGATLTLTLPARGGAWLS